MSNKNVRNKNDMISKPVMKKDFSCFIQSPSYDKSEGEKKMYSFNKTVMVLLHEENK